jgi:hypothetical protein
MLTPLHALADLTQVAQTALSKHRDSKIREALASSIHLTAQTALNLTKDPEHRIRHLAYRKVEDTTLLTSSYDKAANCCRAVLARNPHLDTESLVVALNSEHRETVLSALINPASPEAERRKLTLCKVIQLTNVAGPLGNRVVRSHEVLIKNPWLREYISDFPNMLRRAAFSLDDLNLDEYNTLVASGWSRFKDLHPLSTSIDMLKTPIEELADIGSPAIDLWIAQNPRTTIDQARLLITRNWTKRVEPHVLSRLFQRFGSAYLTVQNSRDHADTRINSAAWLEPSVTYYPKLRNDWGLSLKEMALTSHDLADDPNAWQMLVTLDESWHGTMHELVKASQNL